MLEKFIKISIIIPAYNEERTIAEIVKRVQSASVFGLKKEIIIVNNCSQDSTLEIAQKLQENNPEVRVLSTPENSGKGGAVKLGFQKAEGDILIIQDADLEYDPGDFETVLKPILDGRTEITNGVRMGRGLRKDLGTVTAILGYIGNDVITFTTNMLYQNNAGEYEGCYKAMTKNLADSVEVKTDDFDFDNELICKILKRGIKPIDVPIHYYARDYSEGKKINWRHGFQILWTIIKYRFVD